MSTALFLPASWDIVTEIYVVGHTSLSCRCRCRCRCRCSNSRAAERVIRALDNTERHSSYFVSTKKANVEKGENLGSVR